MPTLLLKQTEENRPKEKGWELFLGLQLNSNRIHKSHSSNCKTISVVVGGGLVHIWKIKIKIGSSSGPEKKKKTKEEERGNKSKEFEKGWQNKFDKKRSNTLNSSSWGNRVHFQVSSCKTSFVSAIGSRRKEPSFCSVCLTASADGNNIINFVLR